MNAEKAISKLSDNFWRIPDLFHQRMTTKEWRAILLEGADVVFIHGRQRRLVAKKLGAGVVEASLAPLEEK